MRELTGPRARDFAESRRRAAVHERTFLRSSPAANLVITTLEGDDPPGALQRMVEQDDEFTRWFLEQVHRVHGVDLSEPLHAPMPELVADSERA